MDFDIQTTIEDNVRLKKALQMSKFSYDKLEKECKEINSLYAQALQRNRNIKQDYCQLQKKYQQSFTENIKDNNTLITQIEELKKIIQNKKRQLEHIQIKLIPNLDQDMLRVKIIGEMEGPYQQTVDKKDKQIQKLKQKNSQLQRKLQIAYLSRKSRQIELKKQRDEIKSRYEQDNHRLMRELNLSLSRNQVQSIQTSIIKNQKKQIEELKVTLQCMNKNEENYQQDLKSLKQQRKSLLEKLNYLNQKQALFLQGKFTKSEIDELKDQKNRLNLELNRIKAENQKYERVKQKLQKQKFKIQSELQKELLTEKNKFSLENNQLTNQIYQMKQEIKRLKITKTDTQTEKDKIINKLNQLEREQEAKSKQIQRLVMESSRVINQKNQKQNQNSANYFEISKKQENQKIIENQTKKFLINKKKRSIEYEEEEKNTHESKEKFQQIKKQNEKLKKKLHEANQKIMELLKDKMKTKNKVISPQRDRIISNIEKPKGVFLEYEDCAIKPIIQPTLYTYMDITSRK